MNENEQKTKKVFWLSEKKLIFETEIALGKCLPCRHQSISKKRLLVMAEEGKDLFFIDNGENGGYFKDLLCWFCQNAISVGKLGHIPTCLLGKYVLDVTICRDFVPGACFGENMDNDVGERRVMAEKILPLIEWQSRGECQFFNTDKAYEFIGPDEGDPVVENPSARFCEILHTLPKPNYCRTCKRFELSREPSKRKMIESRKRILIDYINSLETLESKKQ